jgi:hypothetical protein
MHAACQPEALNKTTGWRDRLNSVEGKFRLAKPHTRQIFPPGGGAARIR